MKYFRAYLFKHTLTMTILLTSISICSCKKKSHNEKSDINSNLTTNESTQYPSEEKDPGGGDFNISVAAQASLKKGDSRYSFHTNSGPGLVGENGGPWPVPIDRFIHIK
ncbi:MAG: hypothetical protein KA436_03225 [Oligoflexales bacterium]|nr:hypothetical protein [Oligoflexales bacterium]